MLSEKEDGTETRKGSKTKKWNNEDNSTIEEKKIGLSVNLMIHHYADPSCSKKMQKVAKVGDTLENFALINCLLF